MGAATLAMPMHAQLILTPQDYPIGMASLEPSVSDSRDYIFNMMIRANNIVQDIYQYARKIDTNKSFLSGSG